MKLEIYKDSHNSGKKYDNNWQISDGQKKVIKRGRFLKETIYSWKPYVYARSFKEMLWCPTFKKEKRSKITLPKVLSNTLQWHFATFH